MGLSPLGSSPGDRLLPELLATAPPGTGRLYAAATAAATTAAAERDSLRVVGDSQGGPTLHPSNGDAKEIPPTLLLLLLLLLRLPKLLHTARCSAAAPGAPLCSSNSSSSNNKSSRNSSSSSSRSRSGDLPLSLNWI